MSENENKATTRDETAVTPTVQPYDDSGLKKSISKLESSLSSSIDSLKKEIEQAKKDLKAEADKMKKEMEAEFKKQQQQMQQMKDNLAKWHNHLTYNGEYNSIPKV